MANDDTKEVRFLLVEIDPVMVPDMQGKTLFLNQNSKTGEPQAVLEVGRKTIVSPILSVRCVTGNAATIIADAISS